MHFLAKLEWAAASLPRASAWSTLVPKGSGECHQDTALEHSTQLFNPILPVLTDANLSGITWIHISSASLQRIQPIVPSHQRTPVFYVSIQKMRFSLWFSPQHTSGTFWLPQSWKLKAQPHIHHTLNLPNLPLLPLFGKVRRCWKTHRSLMSWNQPSTADHEGKARNNPSQTSLPACLE